MLPEILNICSALQLCGAFFYAPAAQGNLLQKQPRPRRRICCKRSHGRAGKLTAKKAAAAQRAGAGRLSA